MFETQTKPSRYAFESETRTFKSGLETKTNLKYYNTAPKRGEFLWTDQPTEQSTCSQPKNNNAAKNDGMPVAKLCRDVLFI